MLRRAAAGERFDERFCDVWRSAIPPARARLSAMICSASANAGAAACCFARRSSGLSLNVWISSIDGANERPARRRAGFASFGCTVSSSPSKASRTTGSAARFDR